MSNQKEVSKDYIIERAETLGYCTEGSQFGTQGLCLLPKPCGIHMSELWHDRKFNDDYDKRRKFISSL